MVNVNFLYYTQLRRNRFHSTHKDAISVPSKVGHHEIRRTGSEKFNSQHIVL